MLVILVVEGGVLMFKEHEDEMLWNSVAILKEQNHPENALAVFKSLIERTLSTLKLSTTFLEEAKMELPSNELVDAIRVLDKNIYKSLETQDLKGAYQILLDYLETLSEATPGLDKNKILARILVEQTQEQTKGIAPRWTITIPMQEEVGYTNSYSTLEVAEIVGVSDQTIRRWCEKGKYPDAIKTKGGHWRIPKKYFKITLEEAQKRQEFEIQLNDFNHQHGEVDEGEFL